ncbi:NAD-P-binding protein [Apiospora phragmitis]|uniref:NAD-P-binding protein n=1 Tax=Apiospora phragmitis TaxID=2905665 RepID=A0ABR1X795_9PEZI
MAPIRIGFIGLSKTGWAPQSHLLYLKQTDKFEIVAIQNSSVESARDAIKLHGLPESTKAYGNAEDIANDPNVDLVVCSTRVDQHKECIVPSLKAGKDVYVEWPLGKSLADAEEIVSSRKQAALAVVGLQGRHASIISTIKEFIASGKLGDVLSSTWSGYGVMGGDVAQEAIAYFADKSVGCNLLTVHSGHALDWVQQALGSTFVPTESNALMTVRRPFVKLTKSDGTVISDHHPQTAEDTIFINGVLASSVPVQYSLCGGAPFKGAPALDWRILGTKGELRVTASGVFLQIGYPDQKIDFFDSVADQVTEIPIQTDEWDKLPIPARNVARFYEGIAGDEKAKKLLCGFEDAIERHRFLEGLDG